MCVFYMPVYKGISALVHLGWKELVGWERVADSHGLIIIVRAGFAPFSLFVTFDVFVSISPSP